ELAEGGSDLDRRREGLSIVVAPHIEATHVFQTKKKVHDALAAGARLLIDDRHGIVVRHIRRVSELLSQSNRILRLRSGHIRDLFPRAPFFAAIGRAPQHDVDRSPIALIRLASFTVRQQCALRCADDAGDAVKDVIVGARCEEVGLFQQWLSRERKNRRTKNQRSEEDGKRDSDAGHLLLAPGFWPLGPGYLTAGGGSAPIAPVLGKSGAWGQDGRNLRAQQVSATSTTQP